MRIRLPGLAAVLFLSVLAACGGGGGDGGSAGNGTATPLAAGDRIAVQLKLAQVAGGLDMPVFLSAPAGDPRLFIVERPGRVRIVAGGALLPQPFLDISSLTSTDGERGLLSIAFDPGYAANGLFYVYYTDTAGNIAVDRYRVSATDTNVADPASALRILSIAHPTFSNHYGGQLTFGPDGFLYLGVGNGGGDADTNLNAADTGSLLGKLLRIDVSAASPAQPYAVPATNPFAAGGGRPEVWAYGLRNPWRYSFDAPTGLLYVGDVGETKREEIDVVPLAQGGLNYGWNTMEGSLCFNAATCNTQGLVLPVLDYAHDNSTDGGCAVVGGYVYRGSAIPELQGSYLYTDLCSGRLKGFDYSNGAAALRTDFGALGVGSIFSFGQDAQKELYILSANGVYRIVRQ